MNTNEKKDEEKWGDESIWKVPKCDLGGGENFRKLIKGPPLLVIHGVWV